MDNVLLTDLPTEWNGYKVNTSFRIGIQIFMLMQDKSISSLEMVNIILSLLFEDERGIREHPVGDELNNCLMWFLNGWNHDKSRKTSENEHVIDFENDQWRIYADFRQIYKINLNEEDMHWWEFCAMLWNMPAKLSSFMQVISIRKKKINSSMSAEEKKCILDCKYTYGLDEEERSYNDDEKAKIDEYDRMMAMEKAKKQAALDFMRG